MQNDGGLPLSGLTDQAIGRISEIWLNLYVESAVGRRETAGSGRPEAKRAVADRKIRRDLEPTPLDINEELARGAGADEMNGWVKPDLRQHRQNQSSGAPTFESSEQFVTLVANPRASERVGVADAANHCPARICAPILIKNPADQAASSVVRPGLRRSRR
jgi:hypothetical protein